MTDDFELSPADKKSAPAMAATGCAVVSGAQYLGLTLRQGRPRPLTRLSAARVGIDDAQSGVDHA